MQYVLEALIALIVGIVIAAVAPMPTDKARCPEGWWLHEGVRTMGTDEGEYSCARSPGPLCCGDARGICEVPCPPQHSYTGRIYCTGGMHPIVVDERTVGCQR